MPAQTKPKHRPVIRPLIRSAVRWLAVAAAAGALGAVAAAAALGLAPRHAAALAGPLFCPAGAQASIGYAYNVQFTDWNGHAWEAQTPELSCLGAEGAAVTPQRAFEAGWYGLFAVSAAAMASLLYGMWAISSSLAGGRPAAPPVPAGPDYPAMFLEECCEVAPKKRARAGELQAAYAAWSRAKGHRPAHGKALAREWKRLGLRRGWLVGKGMWKGAGLKS